MGERVGNTPVQGIDLREREKSSLLLLSGGQPLLRQIPSAGQGSSLVQLPPHCRPSFLSSPGASLPSRATRYDCPLWLSPPLSLSSPPLTAVPVLLCCAVLLWLWRARPICFCTHVCHLICFCTCTPIIPLTLCFPYQWWSVKYLSQVLTMYVPSLCRFLLWKKEMGRKMEKMDAVWAQQPENSRYFDYLCLVIYSFYASSFVQK